MSASAMRGATPWSRRLEPAEGVVGFVGLLAVWQISISVSHLPKALFPSPLEVAEALVALGRSGILYEYILLSVTQYLQGVGFGIAAGLALGLAIAANPKVAASLLPIINFFYAIVEVAWIPLFILWWGYGPVVVVVAVAYVVASPLVQNVVVGVRSVPPVYARVIGSLGGGTWRVIYEVTLPAILPSLINGLRVGAGFGFRALIFAEMIAQSEGIGFLIFNSAANQQTDRTVAGMIVMGVMWLVLDRCYLRPLERASVQRWGLLTEAQE